MESSLPNAMRAVEISQFGDPDVLRPCTRPLPSLQAGEVLLKIGAAGVNRPDATQRRGLYPPPPGITDIPGLDVAGQIVAVADDVASLKPGDFVCGLVAGGGYAEYAAVPAVQCLPMPRGLTLMAAASLPEVFFTAWNKVIEVGRLALGESILVQGGTSGVGMAATQIARHCRDALVITTSGSAEKCEQSKAFGAQVAINYAESDWCAAAFEATGGRGLDVILDAQAGDYLQREVEILAVGGRIVLMGTHRDVESTVNFRQVVRRRLTIAGSVVRSRTPREKGVLADNLLKHVWPLIERGQIVTHVQRLYPLREAAAAHWMLERNEQIGKIVLVVDAELCQRYSSTMGMT
ncbi:MAG: NAD(P)H-quinone oxidoreductase [Pigmentiphaga sp.]